MKYSINRIILQCRLGSNQNHPSSTQVSFDFFQFDLMILVGFVKNVLPTCLSARVLGGCMRYCMSTWSVHQYQEAEIVRPKIMADQGKGSSCPRNK